jgi:hypothetical protein
LNSRPIALISLVAGRDVTTRHIVVLDLWTKFHPKIAKKNVFDHQGQNYLNHLWPYFQAHIWHWTSFARKIDSWNWPQVEFAAVQPPSPRRTDGDDVDEVRP